MTKQADDDLVKRLKETIEFGLFDAPNPVTFDECLAEIEYLRADLASACSQLREGALDEIAYLGQYTDWQIQAAEREAADRIEAQAAEIERLKRPMDDEEMVAIAKQAATDPLADKAKKWDASVAVSRALSAIAPHIRAREAAAFRAGAEAMQEAAAVAADEYGMTYEVTIGRDRGVRTVEYKDGADAIRALPIGAPT